MKNNKKIVIIIIIMQLLILSFSCNVFAGGPSIEKAIRAMGKMKNGEVDKALSADLGPLINAVIGMIQVAGTGISLIMITILGIKYIMAAPSDKADVKKQIAPMAIGCFILFASVNIVQLVANFTANLFK